MTAGRPFSASAATGAAMIVGTGSWSGLVLVMVMVSVTFWAHRFATGLPCRASSRAASRPCSLRCAWPAAWLRIASLRAGIPCAVPAAMSGTRPATNAPAETRLAVPNHRPGEGDGPRSPFLHSGIRKAASAGHGPAAETRSETVALAAMQFTRRVSSPHHRRCPPDIRQYGKLSLGSTIVANPRLPASRRGGDRVAGSRIRMVAHAPCESGLLRGPHHSPPQGLDPGAQGFAERARPERDETQSRQMEESMAHAINVSG